MLTQLNTSKKSKSSEDDINNQNSEINRGIETILSGGKTKKRKPFHIIFDQIIYFFNREINIYFEFSLNLKKKKQS